MCFLGLCFGRFIQCIWVKDDMMIRSWFLSLTMRCSHIYSEGSFSLYDFTKIVIYIHTELNLFFCKITSITYHIYNEVCNFAYDFIWSTLLIGVDCSIKQNNIIIINNNSLSFIDSKEAATKSILYNYKHGFSGFAVVLTRSQAKHIAGVKMLVNYKLCVLSQTRSLQTIILWLKYTFPMISLCRDSWSCWCDSQQNPQFVHHQELGFSASKTSNQKWNSCEESIRQWVYYWCPRHWLV